MEGRKEGTYGAGGLDVGTEEVYASIAGAVDGRDLGGSG